jgi:hypothetical protein
VYFDVMLSAAKHLHEGTAFGSETLRYAQDDREMRCFGAAKKLR